MGLTERSLVQEVELGVEVLQLRVSVLDGAHDEVQQRLPAVRGLGVQQLGDGSEQEELMDPNTNTHRPTVRAGSSPDLNSAGGSRTPDLACCCSCSFQTPK